MKCYDSYQDLMFLKSLKRSHLAIYVSVALANNCLAFRGGSFLLLLGGIDALNAKNDEVYRNVKLKRNRMRSAQRAHEQRAYCRLRELVPSLQSQQRKASKLETLKHTCAYIRYLKEILEKLQMIKLQRDETEKSKEGDNLAKAGVIGEVPRNNELTCWEIMTKYSYVCKVDIAKQHTEFK